MILGLTYEKLLTYMAILIGIILLLAILSAPMKRLFKVLTSCIVATVVLVIFNFVGHYIDFTLGINPASILTVGILGIPGFMLLVLFRYFLF